MPRPTNADAMRIANAKRASHFLGLPVEVPTQACHCSIRRRNRAWVLTCSVHGVLQLTMTWPYAMRRADKHARGEL